LNTILERAKQLKKEFIDFVMEAEGDLAISLEAFFATQSSKSESQSTTNNDMILDIFLTEGKVKDQTPVDLFLESQPELSECDRLLIHSWRGSFVGLFAVTQISADGCDLMNWMTGKHYMVRIKSLDEQQLFGRVKNGEILLARIIPVTDTYWMFAVPFTLMGKLGKPKLAVAIGNFKQNYKNHLYADAPELLEEAWQSVEQYHQAFVDYFGSNEITSSGYQIQKKMADFHDFMTNKRLELAGIDSSKTLKELAEKSGISEQEMSDTAAVMGGDAKAINQLLDSNKTIKMMMPPVELPERIKRAEEVTVISHPHWGQIFLTNYTKFKKMLEAEDWRSVENAEKMVQKYLDDSEINTCVWHHLAGKYPMQLEKILRDFFKKENFNLEHDLNELLIEFYKPLKPELPETASVPVHLHNLFQEALVEVNSKNKSKSKSKSITGHGFRA
jgi:hypothetical protein